MIRDFIFQPVSSFRFFLPKATDSFDSSYNNISNLWLFIFVIPISIPIRKKVSVPNFLDCPSLVDTVLLFLNFFNLSLSSFDQCSTNIVQPFCSFFISLRFQIESSMNCFDSKTLGIKLFRDLILFHNIRANSQGQVCYILNLYKPCLFFILLLRFLILVLCFIGCPIYSLLIFT